MARPDPFRIYKVGEDPRFCHAIDFSGWQANGWSDTPVPVVPVTAEEPTPEPTLEPTPEPIIVPHDLTVARKTKRSLPKED